MRWISAKPGGENPGQTQSGEHEFGHPHRATLAVVVAILTVPLVMKIPVSNAVPMVAMFKSTVVSVPVTQKKRLSIVTRRDPISPRIWWSSPNNLHATCNGFSPHTNNRLSTRTLE